jgi:stage IV sporulation protein FB
VFDQSFYSWGLPVGSVLGIRIRIHWTLLALWLYELHGTMQAQGPGARSVGFWMLGIALLFGSILLHELGHCLAARMVGGDADEVLLWPLGGLAFADGPRIWRSQLAIAAGGPLVTVLIVAASWVAFRPAGAPDPSSSWYRWHLTARSILVDWNAYLLVFNCLPLYPLDGGRVLQALLWGFFRRGGGHVPWAYGKASIIVVWVSRCVGVPGLVWSLFEQGYVSVFIFGWCLAGAEDLRARLKDHGEDYELGYDFSRGYVSLEGRPRRRRDEKDDTRGDRCDPRNAEREEVDRLLEKISHAGMESLSEVERRFLEEASRRRRS